MSKRTSDAWIVVAGLVVTLAAIGVTGFLVAWTSGAAGPGVTAAVLTAFAAVLAAVPPIIRALRGH